MTTAAEKLRAREEERLTMLATMLRGMKAVYVVKVHNIGVHEKAPFVQLSTGDAIFHNGVQYVWGANFQFKAGTARSAAQMIRLGEHS